MYEPTMNQNMLENMDFISLEEYDVLWSKTTLGIGYLCLTKIILFKEWNYICFLIWKIYENLKYLIINI